MTLCMAFPTLFGLAVQKEALIREVWDNSREGGWIPCFSRPFNDWEVMEVGNFSARYSTLEICL